MPAQHLYGSTGTWIAFLVGQNIYDPSGEWAGWLPWEDDYVVAPDGKYLGTIIDDRMVRLTNPPNRGYAGYPLYPGAQPRPAHPGAVAAIPLPAAAKDIGEF